MAQHFIQVPEQPDLRFTDHLGEPAWDHKPVQDSNGVVLKNPDGSVVTKRVPAMRNFFAFLCELTIDEKFKGDLKGIEALETIGEVRAIVQQARKDGAKVVALDGEHVKRLQRVVRESDLAGMAESAHNLIDWCKLVRDASAKDPTVALAQPTESPPPEAKGRKKGGS